MRGLAFTVLGGSGFIGSHVVRRLRELGLECVAPPKGADLRGRELGTVIYCVGLTADFRTRPFETVHAHVSHLADVLGTASIDRLIYLSSARVYRRCSSPASENALLPLTSLDPDDLYDLTKVTGEAVAFAGSCSTCIVRLSNVFGPDLSSSNFLSSLVRDARDRGKIILRTSLDSWKDYISVDDVVDLVLRIATDGTQAIYNLASGVNISHRDLVERLATLTGCLLAVEANAPTVQPPTISIRRIEEEFGFEPVTLLTALPRLIAGYG